MLSARKARMLKTVSRRPMMKKWAMCRRARQQQRNRRAAHGGGVRNARTRRVLLEGDSNAENKAMAEEHMTLSAW